MMKIKETLRNLLLAGLILLTGQSAFAEDFETTMAKANSAYQEKDYATAVKLYEQIANAGNEGAVLYYNLGNAYYKSGEPSRAILWYERALRLSPRNEDIRHNIAFVNQKLIDKIDEMPELFITRWWNALSQSFTSDGWAYASIVFSLLFFLSLVGLLLGKSPILRSISLWGTPVIVICLIFSILFAQKEKQRYEKSPEAIVMDLVLTVKSSPDTQSSDLFVIHEGLKVKVTDRVGEWVEIKLPNGDKGWVEAKTIEEI